MDLDLPVDTEALRGLKAAGRRASSCWKHASGMTPPPGTAIWLQPAQRSDLFLTWLP
ncbi:hypothetical protein [Roseovarius sp. D22-M7]|uniref:hypothetical protein n=1 Tax=Roseovarius sp. D22-M7 TaxID=3127116 RepID=UPI00300FAA19